MGPATVIREDTTLREAASLMLEEEVQGLLVVDAQGEVRGVLTERQLTLDERYLRMACCTVPRVHGQSVTRLEEIEAACVAAGVVRVGEVMETRLTSACVGEGLGTVVERMVRREAEFGIVRDGSSVVGMPFYDESQASRHGRMPLGAHASPTRRSASVRIVGVGRRSLGYWERGGNQSAIYW
jgi:CBS domain-containing protein